MFRNVYYLVLGMVLGAVLGLLVCDDTKKRITKAVQSKAKQLSGSVKSSSKKSKEAVHAVKSAIKGLA